MSELDLLVCCLFFFFSYGLQPRANQTPRENTGHGTDVQ